MRKFIKKLSILKAQSAIEYLITYGWAILVIAIIFGILAYSGVFNNSNINSTCIPAEGFLCSNPILNSSGALSINIGYIGQTIALTGISCSNNSSQPNNFIPGNLNLQSGEIQNILFECATSLQFNQAKLGTQLNEYIWIEYVKNGEKQTAEFANLKASVVSANPSDQNTNMFTYGEVINSIYVGHFRQVNFNPNGTIAYVSDGNGGGNLYTVNVISNTLSNSIETYGSPGGVVFNNAGTLAYVLNDGTINVISVPTNMVVNMINQGYNIQNIVLNPSGSNAFITAYDNVGPFSTMNLSANSITNNIYGMYYPGTIALNKQNNIAYVSAGPAGQIYLVNTISDTLITPSLNFPGGYIGLDNNGNIYDLLGTYMEVINTTTNTVKSTINFMSGYYTQEIVFNPSSSLAYVVLMHGNNENDPGNGYVAVIDTSTDTVVNYIEVGTAPEGISINPEKNIIYVINYMSSDISVISI